jgi:NAD(P)-dependent dehydrogenase (short-subunit alcohol dehydrogenase family)
LANPLLISKGKLNQNSLKDQVAIVTGSGRGIGFEAARSLAWLGSKVIIAEIDKKTGTEAALKIEKEIGSGSAYFIQADVGDGRSIKNLANESFKIFKKVDIILNNATKVSVGSVKDTEIKNWDIGYQVNLQGPVNLAKVFLPGMLERNHGTFVCVSSSGAAPYMGAYEVFKTAQVELSNTLSLELEGTDVNVFTIGPGLVKTPGAMEGIEKLAPLFKQTVDEFFEIGKDWIISVEAAGAGFAAAIALAHVFNGKEVASKYALMEAGIDISEKSLEQNQMTFSEEDLEAALVFCKKAQETLKNLSDQWINLNNFMKQWIMRDFKNNTGLTVEESLFKFDDLENGLRHRDYALLQMSKNFVDKLGKYYDHYYKQTESFVKDSKIRKEQTDLINSWQDNIKKILEFLNKFI